MRFKLGLIKIGRNVINGLPLLRHFFEIRCVARVNLCEDEPSQIVTTFCILMTDLILILFRLSIGG